MSVESLQAIELQPFIVKDKRLNISAKSAELVQLKLSAEQPVSLAPLKEVQNLASHKKTLQYQQGLFLCAAILLSIACFCVLPLGFAAGSAASVLLVTGLGLKRYQKAEITRWVERLCHGFCSEALLNKSPEAWSQEVLKTFSLEKDCCATDLRLSFTLPAEKYLHYCFLQQEIAKHIPEERNRPTIYLKLRGNALTDQQMSFGIIGGVGPLSDAAILQTLLEKLENQGQIQRVKIDLFSSPPPRPEAKVHFVLHFFNYVRQLTAFLRSENIAKFCVTSNTAHLNFDFLQGLASNKMINLVEAVAERVDLQSHVLVLGTIDAYRKELYPSIFRKRGVATTNVSEQEAIFLQQFINSIKANQMEEEAIGKFLDLLEQVLVGQSQDTPITHILLGCTELPLGLAFSQDPAVIQKIEGIKKKYLLIDTEREFSTVIFNALHNDVNIVI